MGQYIFPQPEKGSEKGVVDAGRGAEWGKGANLVPQIEGYKVLDQQWSLYCLASPRPQALTQIQMDDIERLTQTTLENKN